MIICFIPDPSDGVPHFAKGWRNRSACHEYRAVSYRW